MIKNDGILHKMECFGTIFKKSLLRPQNEICHLIYNFFCHDSISHCKFSKCSKDKKNATKDKNLKLNVIHNVRKQMMCSLWYRKTYLQHYLSLNGGKCQIYFCQGYSFPVLECAVQIIVHIFIGNLSSVYVCVLY